KFRSAGCSLIGDSFRSADGLACGDLPGIEAKQMQPAVEAGVLDLDAAIHHHGQALFFTVVRRILIPDAELHPDRGRSNGDDIVDHARNVACASEDIHDVWYLRQRSEVRISLL